MSNLTTNEGQGLEGMGEFRVSSYEFRVTGLGAGKTFNSPVEKWSGDRVFGLKRLAFLLDNAYTDLFVILRASFAV